METASLEAKLERSELDGIIKTEIYSLPVPVRFRWKEGEEVRIANTQNIGIRYSLDPTDRELKIIATDYPDIPFATAEVSVVIDHTAENWTATYVPETSRTVEGRAITALRHVGFKRGGCGCGNK